LKPVKFFGKLSLVLLLFFSLQGEVVQRYVDLIQGKLEHRATVPKKTAERQQLIRLQSYTQKFVQVALPPEAIHYEFCLPVKPIAKIGYFITDCGVFDRPQPELPSLRGPPSINS
jgi:hypothetical protein